MNGTLTVRTRSGKELEHLNQALTDLGHRRKGRRPGFDWAGVRFFPKPQVLEEAEGDHRQQCVAVESQPVPTLTMVEPQLLLHLLVPLLTDPASLEGLPRVWGCGAGRV